MTFAPAIWKVCSALSSHQFNFFYHIMHPDLHYVVNKILSMTLSLQVFINSPTPVSVSCALENHFPESYIHNHKALE